MPPEIDHAYAPLPPEAVSGISRGPMLNVPRSGPTFIDSPCASATLAPLVKSALSEKSTQTPRCRASRRRFIAVTSNRSTTELDWGEWLSSTITYCCYAVVNC